MTPALSETRTRPAHASTAPRLEKTIGSGNGDVEPKILATTDVISLMTTASASLKISGITQKEIKYPRTVAAQRGAETI